jgi:hypothetical protein
VSRFKHSHSPKIFGNDSVTKHESWRGNYEPWNRAACCRVSEDHPGKSICFSAFIFIDLIDQRTSREAPQNAWTSIPVHFELRYKGSWHVVLIIACECFVFVMLESGHWW